MMLVYFDHRVAWVKAWLGGKCKGEQVSKDREEVIYKAEGGKTLMIVCCV